MLVLSRKESESIIIGAPRENGVGPIDPIVTIQVLEIRGDKVRIGITAGPEIPVHRHEVFELIQSQEGNPNGQA